VHHQKQKESHWIADQMKDSELPYDFDRDPEQKELFFFGSEQDEENGARKKDTKELMQAKAELQFLLLQPLHAMVIRTPGGSNTIVRSNGSGGSSLPANVRRGRKPTQFLTVQQNPDNDWKKRKNGFFVYAK